MTTRKVILIPILLILALSVVWYVDKAIQPELLRSAMAEAVRLCAKSAEEQSCPATSSSLDPWERPYQCRLAKDRKIMIFSLGADGVIGGKAHDADVACSPFAAKPPADGNNACFCHTGSDAEAFLTHD